MVIPRVMSYEKIGCEWTTNRRNVKTGRLKACWGVRNLIGNDHAGYDARHSSIS